ncbi:hypothetical protein PLICRDRAFT_114072, partial [Plicaturopsis crispa FD-325 SS-3]
SVTHRCALFLTTENAYSLVYRDEDREMFPTLKVRFGVDSIPWSPVAYGLLTRPIAQHIMRESEPGVRYMVPSRGKLKMPRMVNVLDLASYTKG